MESDKIALLVTQYFEGQTSVAEEMALRKYFTSSEIPPDLVQYKPLFQYLASNSSHEFTKEIPLLKDKRNSIKWVSIAASVVVLLGVGLYTFRTYYTSKPSTDLGSFNDPQVAFEETQKALALLSMQVNTGIESVRYVQTYEDTRDKIFVNAQ
jgi:hypothetical protein